MIHTEVDQATRRPDPTHVYIRNVGDRLKRKERYTDWQDRLDVWQLRVPLHDREYIMKCGKAEARIFIIGAAVAKS